MGRGSPFGDDVYLKGTLLVRVTRSDGRPRAGERVAVCGFG
jgi:hypothetical protein